MQLCSLCSPSASDASASASWSESGGGDEATTGIREMRDANALLILGEFPTLLSGMHERLPQDFDPAADLVRRFNTGRVAPLPDGAVDDHFVSDNSAQRMLQSSEDGSPRSLALFGKAVTMTSDPEIKAHLIFTYEQRKALLPHNAEEAAHAETNLRLARSVRHALGQRVQAYQLAVMYTNDLTEKARVRDEYVAFCNAHRAQ